MARTAFALFLLSCLLLAAPGCGAPETEQVPATGDVADAVDLPDQVATAVAIARELAADPGDGEAILDRHGLTEEGFDQLMYEIAADPELTAAYQEALAE